MVDKKKMTVAEMIAMARKADGGGEAPPAAPPPASSAQPTTPEQAGEPAAPAAESKPAPAKSASGGRPSVAEILAAARDGGAKKEEPAAKAPAPKKPAPKPAAKAEPAATGPSEPRDTASILAEARKSAKAGPMSKAEAAAKVKADPKAAAKPKIVVPPMPPKPAYAMPKGESPAKAKAAGEQDRRGFLSLGFWNVSIVSALWTLATVKFMFPNVRREPPSKFKVGLPDAFPAGQVQTKFKAQYGVWIVNGEYNGEKELYALKTVCTHLGCTPNWLEAEQKFKCPCHGSGFYKDGINFEGPAPRPLERYAISIAGDGQVEIDKSRTFQEEMGQWQDPACFIPV